MFRQNPLKSNKQGISKRKIERSQEEQKQHPDASEITEVKL